MLVVVASGSPMTVDHQKRVVAQTDQIQLYSQTMLSKVADVVVHSYVTVDGVELLRTWWIDFPSLPEEWTLESMSQH